MNITNIVLIIIGAGVFGGIINYFRNIFNKHFRFIDTIKPILLGLAASALVPLFLNMISSDLLKSKEDLEINYLVFLGFCLISAIFSGEFIDSIAKKLLNQVGELKKEIEDTNTEDDSIEISNIDNISLTQNQKKILDAFVNSKYTYRSVSGLSKQTGIDKPTLKIELVKLQKMGLVESISRQKGPRWRITSDGFKK